MTVQVFYPSPVDQLVSELPLKKMDSTLLSRAILKEVWRNDLDLDLFDSAIAFAAYFHRDQTRAQRGAMPRVHYIEHPLRLTLRLMRYGVTDQSVLLAAVLHDTVEDSAQEIAEVHSGREPRTELEARRLALRFIAGHYGAEVSTIVRRLSNPISAPGLTREESDVKYRAHVVEAIEDVRVLLVKFSDFEDNAGGLHHNVGPGTEAMVARLAMKYQPLVPHLSERISRADVAQYVTKAGRQKMREHIDAAAVTLRQLNAA